MDTADPRLTSPSTQRNRVPILEVLATVFDAPGAVVELASGTGEHGIYMAQHLDHLEWQPSDPNPRSRASIAAHAEQARRNGARVWPPLALDATDVRWSAMAREALAAAAAARGEAPPSIRGVVCINMIHISPWACTLGLMRGAAALLDPGAALFTYGPYKRDGAHTAPSNQAFDRSLQSQDPSWGVRDLEAVVAAAQAQGFTHERVVEMPANNMCLVFRR